MSGNSDAGRPAETGRLPRDFAVGLVILGFCAVTYWISLGIAKAPAALAQNVQPATFPRMVLSVIAALTVLMMVLGIRGAEPKRKAPKPVMLLTGAMMVVFVMAFEALGPLAAMFLFCLVLPLLWGERFSAKLVAFALALPTMVHLVFDAGLGVQFPRGIVETFLETLI